MYCIGSGFVAWGTALVLLLAATGAHAFPDYNSGCNNNKCHGAFNSGTYVSLKDGSNWGTDLMDGHLDYILGSNSGARCNVCHSGSGKSIVKLNSSNGTGTLPPLGCMGCHGRAEDNTPSNPDWGLMTGYGAGLRQHHYIKGVTICAGCHADADPANYTPVGEDIPPPYYGDTTFPLIPTNPCNPNNTENRIASALGLDNDGDGVFDMSDPDCASCTPTTCAAEGKNCGNISDGCGGLLNCGSCTTPDTCGGGGTPNVCGCTPTTCTAQGANCGSIPSGCGSMLDCGSCTTPDTCGGAGTPNVCGQGTCTRTTCTAEGKNCGKISDGCGGTLTCGSCTTPETCGGAGTPNVCGCTPATCGSLAVQCGPADNGCGGTLDCGSCPAPESCTAGVCVTPVPDAGSQDAAGASTDASSDARQDAPTEAASDAATDGNDGAAASDAAASDAAASDAPVSDAAASDAAASDAAASDAAASDAASNESSAADAATTDANTSDAAADANTKKANAAGAETNGGCGCHLASERSPADGPWLLALSALFLVGIRRRRRRLPPS